MGNWVKKFKAEIATILATIAHGLLSLFGLLDYATAAPAAGLIGSLLLCKIFIKADLSKAKKTYQNQEETTKTDLYKTLDAIKESKNHDGTPLFPNLINHLESKMIEMHENQYLRLTEASSKIKALELEDNSLSNEIESTVKGAIKDGK